MSLSKIVRKYKRCFFNGSDKTAIELIIKYPWLATINVQYSSCVMFLTDIEHIDNKHVSLTFLHKGTADSGGKITRKIILEIHEKNS